MKNRVIRALSVIQPWADCIVSQGKNVENRSWDTRHRGWVAIHASRALDYSRFEDCEEAYGIRLKPEKLSFGAIVGFAEIVDVVTSETLTSRTDKWFMGPYGFVLKGAVALREPVPARGALSFWSLPAGVQRRALAQLTKAQQQRILENCLSP